MRRYPLTAALTGVLLVILAISSATEADAQARSIVWQRWDVVIDNFDLTLNRFDVTELYEINFRGTFTFGQAVIPLDRVTRIDNVSVTENGQALRSSCNSQRGTFCVRNTVEGLSIVYYFNTPATDTIRNIELKYTVTGGLRSYPEGDQLWWIAVTDDKFGFDVRESTIWVELPPEFAPREGIDPIATYGAQGTIQVNGSLIVATAVNGVRARESFEIRVQYPHNPQMLPAAWQSAFDERRAFEESVLPLLNIGLFTLSILVIIGGPAGVYWFWFTRGRDPEIGPVPEYLSEPPSPMIPAVVGTLIDENAELRDVLSTLIDLAQRGYIVIEEERARFRGSQFTFKRTDKPLDDLSPFERRFARAIFGNSNTRRMDDLKNKFYVHIPRLQQDLYAILVKDGYFKSNPETTRSVWYGMGIVLIALGGVGFMLLIDLIETFGPSLACLPVAIAVTGVAMLIGGTHMPAKTRKGAEEAAKWRAFRHYMENLRQYQDIAGVTDKFAEYLPYAIVFGLDRSWIRQFASLRDVAVPYPGWYYPRYMGGRFSRGYTPGTPLPSAGDLRPGELVSAGGGGLNDIAGGISNSLSSISDGLTSMLNSAGRTLNSRPSSSSSGGGGWSGGGSFGGGGGGGGSRGFG